MFEFVEKVATDIITSLGNTISQMSFDASSYDAQATENDAKAAQCEADASAEEASCPHYKSEPYETTDDDGNTVTKYEQVPDTAADAAAMARAATLRAEAANLKAIAAALRGLAAALRGTLFSMTSQQKQISQASQDSQFAIVATTKLLREGIDVTKRVILSMRNDYDFILVNFANPDMVGHTGVMEAAVNACSAVDICLSKIIEKAEENFYKVIILADHGNADTMINEDGSICTTHTTSKVPFIICDDKVKLKSEGTLVNVAPTILDYMDIAIPKEMEGTCLLYTSPSPRD